MTAKNSIAEALQIIQRSLYCKDLNLYRHALLTADIACHVAKKSPFRFGFTPEQAYVAGVLHDVGKLCVSSEILEKKGSLTTREWEVVQRHPVWGYEYVQGTVFQEYGDVILRHHEKQDGTGYPLSLEANNIDDNVRLVSLADQMAAFLDNRPYRRRVTHFGLICREIHKITTSLFAEIQAPALIEALKEFSVRWVNESSSTAHQAFAVAELVEPVCRHTSGAGCGRGDCQHLSGDIASGLPASMGSAWLMANA